MNLPFVFVGLLSITTQYKLGRTTKKRFYGQLLLWIIVLTGLVFAERAYTLLSQYGLTETDSLSLFDIVQITAIVMLFYVANRTRIQANNLEHRFNDLHQELSITISDMRRSDGSKSGSH